jgi:hypothetical protein
MASYICVFPSSSPCYGANTLGRWDQALHPNLIHTHRIPQTWRTNIGKAFILSAWSRNSGCATRNLQYFLLCGQNLCFTRTEKSRPCKVSIQPSHLLSQRMRRLQMRWSVSGITSSPISCAMKIWNLGKPFDESLQLHGGEPLTLLKIVPSQLPTAELAFHSACHTADTAELTEDSI